MTEVECITSEGMPLAYLVQSTLLPDRTTFVTPPEANLQIGFVVYPAGGVIAQHIHHPIERHIVGTAEVLIVKKGRCEVDVFNNKRELVAKRILQEGDVMLTVSGGHGFRLLEDTVLLEVKQGPYSGVDEKVRF